MKLGNYTVQNKKLKKIICFDLDNVLCKTKNKDYKNAKPIKNNIIKVNELFKKGHVIKIFTARYMGRNNENILAAKKQGYKMTYSQLKKWGVSFHKLLFGKPSFDLFIDDKSIYFKKKWNKDIINYI